MSALLLRRSKTGQASSMEVEPTLLAEPNAKEADSLVSSNEPDDLDNEQTWPAEEEMKAGGDSQTDGMIPDAKQGTTPKRVRKVPKGTSEYQAAWIIDDDEDEDGEDDEEGEGDAEEELQDEPEEMVELLTKDDDEMETDGRRTVAFEEFEELDAEEEDRQ